MWKPFLVLIGLLIGWEDTPALAQEFRCSLENDSIVSEYVYEFDVRISSCVSTWSQLAAVQVVITAVAGPSENEEITAEIVSGSSEMVSEQQPDRVMVFNKEIRIPGRMNPGAGRGTVIATSPSSSRLCRIRLTSKASLVRYPVRLRWKDSGLPCTKIVVYENDIATELKNGLFVNELKHQGGLATTDRVGPSSMSIPRAWPNPATFRNDIHFRDESFRASHLVVVSENGIMVWIGSTPSLQTEQGKEWIIPRGQLGPGIYFAWFVMPERVPRMVKFLVQ